MTYSIFVQIAAYDDAQLAVTLKSAMDNADNINRVFFGICWQSDIPILFLPDRCDYFWMAKKEARGVGLARQIAQSFYAGQDFILQIDSHTLFSPGWDTKLIVDFTAKQISLANKLSYSNYLPGWSTYPKGKMRKLVPKAAFNDFGVLRFQATEELKDDLIFPPISCHFIFSIPDFFTECPPDPNIFYNGEEVTLSLRAFTHGWTNVQPREPYLYHKYNNGHAHPVIWQNNPGWQSMNQPSIDRVKALCEGRADDIYPYGLGSGRTVEEFEQILNINFAAKKVGVV